ncbi:MAG: bifunctional folylpolyglutamate synthase/dihydrofolate synthase [Ruminococcaceae bacterium]|nr:bifunctional folylpolyglutamate synthase/dihydrofolate synthase [Oscillospiraceae bacterium]
MTYQEALAYIHSISWTGSRPGLTRITELLEKMGNPQNSLRFVHVAGTNGKGSFCKMTESILRAAGYKTGLYLSPYIRFFNERMQINGRMIADEALAELTAYVKTFADTMDDQPTEFELITAIAFECFKREACDVVVLEVGMGGRLDATNVIERPLLSVITGIALDHTAYLGDTVAAIAGEKAGIIKENVPVLFGGIDEEAYAVIQERAAALHAPCSRTDYTALTNINCFLGGADFTFGGKSYRIPLSGLYQPRNAATVLTAVSLLRQVGLSLPEQAVIQGLSQVEWSGRFEILSKKDPLIVFDGAHNPEGIAAAAACIRHYFGGQKVCLLSGVMADKDYRLIAETLAPFAAKAYTLRPDNVRAFDSESYADVFRQAGVEADASSTVLEAVSRAVAYARENACPLIVLGSLYLYGDVVNALEKLF